jgi:hypothetical protein
MKRETALISILILVLTACSGPATAGEQASGGGPGETPCPQAGPDTRLLADPEHGYCLLYPTAYKVEKPSPGQTDLVIGSLLNVTDPRVGIAVDATSGRTAADVADEVARDLGVEVGRSTVSIGGVEAIVLDKLPGQEMNRQVFFENGGLLYRLTFVPADESLDAFSGMEQLYETVVDSFTFAAASDDEVAGSDCLDPKGGEESFTESDLGLCLLYPEGYSSEKTSENQVVLYVGSLMDVAHPKVFIEIGDASGQDAQTLAEAAATELETAMPGLTIDRSFGLTIGYEPAWVLDNVPGQDITRQVFAVHGSQLYKLTFVPASEDAGDVYVEMESVYELVTRSFRFLD